MNKDNRPITAEDIASAAACELWLEHDLPEELWEKAEAVLLQHLNNPLIRNNLKFNTHKPE